jgi:hypothetical protein
MAELWAKNMLETALGYEDAPLAISKMFRRKSY